MIPELKYKFKNETENAGKKRRKQTKSLTNKWHLTAFNECEIIILIFIRIIKPEISFSVSFWIKWYYLSFKVTLLPFSGEKTHDATLLNWEWRSTHIFNNKICECDEWWFSCRDESKKKINKFKHSIAIWFINGEIIWFFPYWNDHRSNHIETITI